MSEFHSFTARDARKKLCLHVVDSICISARLCSHTVGATQTTTSAVNIKTNELLVQCCHRGQCLVCPFSGVQSCRSPSQHSSRAMAQSLNLRSRKFYPIVPCHSPMQVDIWIDRWMDRFCRLFKITLMWERPNVRTFA